ncbi:MAG: hypothetical protein Q9216_006888 [Gyalolechia sp. 2 TL-2023]
MLWEHLSGDLDMYVVFDHIRKPGLGQAVSERQILRVHLCLLEEIDLENVVYQVRRIQMNFRPEAGYEVAVRVFRALGVPIQDKNASKDLTYGATGISSLEQRSQALSSYLTAAEGIRMQNGAPDRLLDRPATAPITLSQLMPPRRELPFPKEPVKPTTDRAPNVEYPIEQQDINGTDPKNRAKTIKGRAKGKTRGEASRPSSSRAKNKPLAKKEHPKDHPRLAEPILQTTPQICSMSNTHVPTSSSSQPSTSKSAMTEAAPSKINTRSKSSAAAEKPVPIPEQFSRDFENIAPEEYMDRLDYWVRKYQNLPAPEPVVKPRSTDKDQLAAYAAQTEGKRLEALDEMICDYLDDENFAQLVEDVDKSWRRVGLGM